MIYARYLSKTGSTVRELSKIKSSALMQLKIDRENGFFERTLVISFSEYQHDIVDLTRYHKWEDLEEVLSDIFERQV